MALSFGRELNQRSAKGWEAGKVAQASLFCSLLLRLELAAMETGKGVISIARLYQKGAPRLFLKAERTPEAVICKVHRLTACSR